MSILSWQYSPLDYLICGVNQQQRQERERERMEMGIKSESKQNSKTKLNKWVHFGEDHSEEHN